MHYDLNTLIKAHNIEPHKDIALAMFKKKNGLLTIVLRVNAGKIVDVVELEYVTYKDNNGKTL